MSFRAKTILLLVFLSVFQAGVTFVLVHDGVQRTTHERAVADLHHESTGSFQRFNSWKSVLWREAIRLRRDEKFADLLELDSPAELRDELMHYVQTDLMGAGIDALALRRAGEAALLMPFDTTGFDSSDLNAIPGAEEHPVVHLMAFEEGVALVVAQTFPRNDSVADEVFLITRLDAGTLEQLSRVAGTAIYLIVGEQVLVGTGEHPVGEFLADLDASGSAYAARHALPVEGRDLRVNASVRNIGVPANGTGEEALQLVTVIPNSVYETQLNQIRETLLVVTGTAIVVAVLISAMIFSQMSTPFRQLMGAMNAVRAGNFDTKLVRRTPDEFARLYAGFNEMSRTLDRNADQMRHYIQEITGLKEFNEQIIDSIRSGLVVTDIEFRVQKLNRAFLELMGSSSTDLVGTDLRLFTMIPLDSLLSQGGRSVTRHVSDDRTYEFKLYHLTTEDPESSLGGYILFVEDVTLQIDVEQKMFNSEKLATLSVLSAGVAHEINNPLSSILSNVQNLISDIDDRDHQEVLGLLERETKRISRIVQNLLRFSSPDSRRAGSRANDLIREVVDLARYSVPKDKEVTFDLDLAADPPDTAISADELRQVLINIIQNAVHAVPRVGVIRVESLERASHVTIRVKDTGQGIPSGYENKVFDPFFTTGTDGTGLGLSVVYGIVRNNGGTISIESTGPEGTVMRLDLPIYRQLTT